MNRHNMIILGSHDREEFSMNSMKMNGHGIPSTDPNSYESLCENSIEICEFCDKVSKNRYSNIIHTAKHIIIPLIKQKVYQCLQCLHHFTSENSLKHHIVLKHGDFTKSNMSLVNETIDLDNYVPTRNHDSKIKNRVLKIENHDSKIKNRVLKIESHDSKIKNRLLFEEDITESDVILMDLTTDCQVNVELFPQPWFGADHNVDKADHDDKTVSYDELMRPGQYKCKKCGKKFPNRYQSIIHETRHFSLRNCQVHFCRTCNTYVAGDASALKRHNKQLHTSKPKPNCEKCGATCEDILKHKIYCPMNTFDNYESDYRKHSKVINLCDMCFSFCKSTELKQYVCIGVRSKLGKRYPCDRCGTLFFEVKMVERRLWFRGKEKDEKKRKALSNVDRLKHIQQRIKMLK